MKYKIGDRVYWCGAKWIVTQILIGWGCTHIMIQNDDPYFWIW